MGLICRLYVKGLKTSLKKDGQSLLLLCSVPTSMHNYRHVPKSPACVTVMNYLYWSFFSREAENEKRKESVKSLPFWKLIDYHLNSSFLHFGFVLFCFFLRPHLWHLEVPWAYITAMATPNLSCICDLCNGNCSWQCQILNLLNEARDPVCIFTETCRILNLLSYNRNSQMSAVLKENTVFLKIFYLT